MFFQSRASKRSSARNVEFLHKRRSPASRQTLLLYDALVARSRKPGMHSNALRLRSCVSCAACCSTDLVASWELVRPRLADPGQLLFRAVGRRLGNCQGRNYRRFPTEIVRLNKQRRKQRYRCTRRHRVCRRRRSPVRNPVRSVRPAWTCSVGAVSSTSLLIPFGDPVGGRLRWTKGACRRRCPPRRIRHGAQEIDGVARSVGSA